MTEVIIKETLLARKNYEKKNDGVMNRQLFL